MKGLGAKPSKSKLLARGKWRTNMLKSTIKKIKYDRVFGGIKFTLYKEDYRYGGKNRLDKGISRTFITNPLIRLFISDYKRIKKFIRGMEKDLDRMMALRLFI